MLYKLAFYCELCGKLMLMKDIDNYVVNRFYGEMGKWIRGREGSRPPNDIKRDEISLNLSVFKRGFNITEE